MFLVVEGRKKNISLFTVRLVRLKVLHWAIFCKKRGRIHISFLSKCLLKCSIGNVSIVRMIKDILSLVSRSSLDDIQYLERQKESGSD